MSRLRADRLSTVQPGPEAEPYTPEGALLQQLHMRLDPVIAEYRRRGWTDSRQPGIHLANGSIFRQCRVKRDYLAADGRLVTLDFVEGTHVIGRVSAAALAHDDRFAVWIEAGARLPSRFAVTPSGEIDTAAHPARERYRAVEEADGPHVYGIASDGALNPLDATAAEELLWLVTGSTPTTVASRVA